MIKISVIILSWNTKEILDRCLESLFKDLRTFKISSEVLVIDNASSDGSPELVEKKYQEVALIKNRMNVGFAKGNNQGLKMAKGKYVLFLNSDTLVKSRALEILIDYLDQNKDTAAVSPLLLNQDATIQKNPCYLRLPSLWIALFYYHNFLRNFIFKFFPSLFLSTTDFSVNQEVEQLPGAALMARKEILDQLNGFDENFPFYFEDSDLSLRIRKLNHKIKVIPLSKIIHLGGESAKNYVKEQGRDKYYLLNFRSLFYFCDKNYPRRKAFLIKTIIKLNLFLKLKINLLRNLP